MSILYGGKIVTDQITEAVPGAGVDLETVPVNNNLIDGVFVPAHQARHVPGGADPIPTAAPGVLLIVDPIGSIGTANFLSRSDHSHAVDGSSIQHIEDGFKTTGAPIISSASAPPLQGQFIITTSPIAANWGGVFGTEFQSMSSAATVSTTGTTFVDYFVFNTNIKSAATFYIGWSYDWNHEISGGSSFQGTVLIDAVTQALMQRQPSVQNLRHASTGFALQTFGVSATHSIRVQLATTIAGGVSRIFRASVMIYRIS